MAKLSIVTALVALSPFVSAQCGAGTPDATVTGSDSSYTATKGSSSVYSGTNYLAAIQAALDAISSSERVSVIASGSIGAGTISITSGKIFEGCGTINAALRPGKGAIESFNTVDVKIPYLTMTGDPYFGLRFYGTKGLTLGQINMNLSGGLGVRFDRDGAANSNVKMDVIRVTGASSHAVETWNIDGLTINSVIAKDCGECGLLLQTTTNARVGLVDGNNVGASTGVVSRGGGRGFFCVSESGGATITSLDLANNGNDAILIENCYGIIIKGGTVNGGRSVRLAARDEFPNNRDHSITLKVDGTSVIESPCGENIKWTLTGTGPRNIC
ncbi:related to unknown, trichothecene gene cluster [Rhynchosporium graminicola]|uniref:Ricin B lectin:Parallel beta-helix repeat n=1 Tax=Rhynchosporium graminicola TaxID=2792576 RepID=A0A1E1LFC8_9HELO|nr:related to unknown, trichothecene gene cluster [Rhynchosporium commune]